MTGSLLLALLAAVLPEVRPDHPRLFFNRDTWPAVAARAKASGTPENVQLGFLLKAADAVPDDPPPCGNTGPVFTPPSEPISNVTDYGPQAARCALAWRFTGERKYVEKVKRLLARSIAAYREAYANRRAVHWFSHGRILALCAYDWICEALTDGERRAIIVPLVEHVEEIQWGPDKPPIIRRNVGGPDTGFYGVGSLLWYSGLAALGDGYCDELADKHFRRGYELNLKLISYRTETAGDDGGLASGVPDYSMGAYPWAHFNFFHTLRSATGEDPAARFPAMGLFPNWIWWNWIPSEIPTRPRSFGFGDDQHEQLFLSVKRLYEHMTQYALFYKDVDPDAARLAMSLRTLAPNRELGDEWPMYPFLLPSDTGVKPFAQGELESYGLKARHFETLGQFVLRSGWTPDATYCLFTAGATTRAHKHWDENNFVIYKNDFLAIDTGSRGAETDTNLRYYYAQTVAHNCVLIHQPGEEMPFHWGLASDEPEAKVNHGGQFEGAAKVLAFETNPTFTYIAADAASTYRAKCTEAVRQFVHVQPDVFIVYDRVGASDPSYRKEWLLHTENEPTVEGKVAKAAYGKGRLFCETLLPADAIIGKVGGPGREFWASGKNWELDPKFLERAAKRAQATGVGTYFGAWRLEVSPASAAKDDRFLHVITVGGESARSVEAKAVSRGNRDGVVLKLADGRTVAFAFNRTGPVGGKVMADGETRELSTAVEPQAGVFPVRRDFLAEHAASGLPTDPKGFAAAVRAGVDPKRTTPDWPSFWAREDRFKVISAVATNTMNWRIKTVGTWHQYEKGRIDWKFNPTYNKYCEYVWQLGRHYFLNDLAAYYSVTKDERAAETWRDMVTSWIDGAPREDNPSGWDGTCWRSLDAALRVEGWSKQFPVFKDSPAVTDDFVLKFMRSVWEHGDYLMHHTTDRNWVVYEMTGLLRMSVTFPFFRESKVWKEFALQRLERELGRQLYPDGFHYELSSGYHSVIDQNYTGIIEFLKNMGEPTPPFIDRGLENAYSLYVKLVRPDGRMPALNDAGEREVKGVMERALSLYPNRQDFRYLATGGAKGSEPPFKSIALPYSGAVVMRTGWGAKDIWAYMDCGPVGRGHQHEDKLNVLLWAYGKEMLTEGGIYNYDTSEMRQYVLNTRSHNSVRIDNREQNRRVGYSWKDEDLQRKADFGHGFSPSVDWCAAKYDEAGYGDRHEVKAEHARRLFFVKDLPGLKPFFIVVDRLSAPDGASHDYEVIWHLEDCRYEQTARHFAADFGGGISLNGFASADVFVDKIGQKEPYFQGWKPVYKDEPHDHRPIHTPTLCGSFVSPRRLVTVLYPSDGACPLVGVEADDRVSSHEVRLLMMNGTKIPWEEREP